MLSTPHILLGGAIGKQVKWPYAALPIAFLSHFPLDAIPHVDAISAFGFSSPRTLPLGVVEAVFGFGLLAVLAARQRRAAWILISGFAALFTDILVLSCAFSPMLREIPGSREVFALHVHTGRSLPTSQWVLGLATQFVVVGLAILVLRRRT